MNIQEFAMMMLNQSPNMKNNPQAQEFMRILNSGDQAAGEQMARNLCNTYGVTPEQAVEQAKSFFLGGMFGR